MVAVLILIMFNLFIDSVISTHVSEYWRTDLDVTWQTTTGTVIFTSAVRRPFDCAAECASVPSCLVFGYSNVTGTCQGYSGLQTPTGSSPVSVLGPTEIIYKNDQSCARAGFEFLQDGPLCVKLFTNEIEWEEARSSCEANHGQLIIIDTQQKLNALSNYLNNIGYDDERLWVGASDLADESIWLWLNGEGINRSHWHDVTLNDFCIERLFANSADCGRIVDKDLSDDHCSLDQKYVCERTDIL